MKHTISINPENTLLSQKLFATADPMLIKHPAIVGGFGSGKTFAIPLRWLYLIDWRGKNQKTKCMMMIVEPTKEMIRDILLPVLDKFFDTHGIKHTYHKTFHDYTIHYKGMKFTAMLRSSDTPASLTGKTLTDVIIDEFDKKHNLQKQQDVWKECISRIRGCKYATVAAVTTPEGYKLTYDLWKSNEKQNSDFVLFKARTQDNFFNPEDYYDNMLAQFDSLLQKQYLEGEFVNLNGSAAYYTFYRDIHVKPCRQFDNPAYPVWVGMDFNIDPLTATAGVFVDGISYRFKEFWMQPGYTKQMIEAIKIEFPDRHIICCPDFTGDHRETSAAVSDVQQLRNAGFEIRGCNFRHQRDRLTPVNNHIEKGHVYYDPSMKHTIEDREKMIMVENVLNNNGDKMRGHITDADDYCLYQQFNVRKYGQIYGT